MKMRLEDSLFDKYDRLKENLAELLLLREDLIAIRDDIVSDDEYKVKLLYKKNIENLVEIQKSLEKDVIKILRAGEIFNHLDFEGNFVNLTQVFDKLNSESFFSESYNDKKMDDLYFAKDLFDEDKKGKDNSDETFKEIAKHISPNVNKFLGFEEQDLWKETLKAKSDNSSRKLKIILKNVKKINFDEELFDVDFMCNEISNIENNLNILNREIEEITKVCKETFDKDKLKEMENLIKKIEAKQQDLIYSINMLISIRDNLMDGFLGMLPNNQSRIFN